MSNDEAAGGGLFPIPQHRIEQGFYLVLFVFVIILMSLTGEWPFDSRLMPLLVGIPTLVLIGLKVLPVDLDAIVDRLNPLSIDANEDESVDLFDQGAEDAKYDPGTQQRIAVVMLGWSSALVVLLYLFGFYFTMPPYVFAFSWYFHRDVRKAGIIATVFTVGATLLFIVLFDVILYTGELGLPNPTYLF